MKARNAGCRQRLDAELYGKLHLKTVRKILYYRNKKAGYLPFFCNISVKKTIRKRG